MIKVHLPRLLNSSLEFERTIRPMSMSMNLNITPLSFASMQLPEDEGIPARAYVELFNSMGFAGVFRVRSPQDAYGEDTTTAELEHAIVEVGDYLVLGEYNGMVPATTAVTNIFSHYRGNKWQLGNISALGSEEVAVQVKYERVLEAIMAIMDQKPECMMSFDFSTRPWTLNIVRRDTLVTAEGRLSRNVNSAKVIYDDTELCTRCYYECESSEDADGSKFPVFDPAKNYTKDVLVSHSGKLFKLTSGHKQGVSWENTTKVLVSDSPTSTWSYVDADTMDKYGLIERTVTTGGDYSPDEALAVANAYISKHKEPRVSVTISAEELSSITGEAFDTFTIGKLFRLALVDYGVTVERTITGLVWEDVFNSPEDVVVILDDEEDTAVTFLHDLDSKGGSGGGGGAAKKEDDVWKEYRSSMQKTDYYIDLFAQRFDRNEEILQQAGLYIDANGVIVYADNNVNMWASKLQVESNRISLVVEGTGSNAKIKPASIVQSINESGSTIKISADHIDIDGLLTAQQFRTALATINTLVGNLNIMGALDVGGVLGVDGMFFNGSNVQWQSRTVVTDVSITLPTVTLSTQHQFMYAAGGNVSTPAKMTGYVVTSKTDGSASVSTETIYFLGAGVEHDG